MNARYVGCAMVFLIGMSSAQAQEWQPPATLQETGLYADWSRKIVAEGALPYSPQYPLWADSAGKERFIALPEGTWIDASDPDAWAFPVGTKLWKEFSFGGRRVETRYIEHAADGWRYATYAWSADETEAPLAPERGIARAVALPGGAAHAIPSRYDCRACHEGRSVPVLGFTALQLSSDRDTNAPHAELRGPGELDLRSLAARGLVRGLPARLLATPPRVAARTDSERAVLGYLYANCAMCHNSSGPLASLGLSFDVTLATGAEAIATTVGQPSSWRGAGEHARDRVSPGDPDGSTLLARMAKRGDSAQMPPLGSSLPDEEALRSIRRWIAEDLVAFARTPPR